MSRHKVPGYKKINDPYPKEHMVSEDTINITLKMAEKNLYSAIYQNNWTHGHTYKIITFYFTLSKS